MEDQQSPQLPLPPPPPNRYITDHDQAGNAVFSTSIPDAAPAQVIGNGDVFYLGYATTAFPADMNGGRDVATYRGFIQGGSSGSSSNAPGITVPGGTVLRFVDIRPGGRSPMHRTVSLDYGVVIEGEVELVLEGSDQSRVMRKGDVAVQRSTGHAWRNRSAEAWARMMFVLQEARPVVVGDGDGARVLREDYGGGRGGMEGVGPSAG